MNSSLWQAKFKAFFWHFLGSFLLAAVMGYLVLVVWYPHPFRALSGGLFLFGLMMVVDLVCGPLLTAVLFNPEKSRRELTFDLSLVVFVQLAALFYGLYSIYLARPLLSVYEQDRFVVVTMSQIDQKRLGEALPQYQKFGMLESVQLAAVKEPKDGDEMLESVELSLSGVEPSLRPSWWRPYPTKIDEVKKQMKPVSVLLAQMPEQTQKTLLSELEAGCFDMGACYFLPLVNDKSLEGWVVLLDEDAKVTGYAQANGFLY